MPKWIPPPIPSNSGPPELQSSTIWAVCPECVRRRRIYRSMLQGHCLPFCCPVCYREAGILQVLNLNGVPCTNLETVTTLGWEEVLRRIYASKSPITLPDTQGQTGPTV